ncbi:hypothetical protein [Faecalicatena contorta]|uniref:Uncharacterized protein n=1 Tax=Faecalicatena contorta TaxID=39482 RepID=A0A315ZWT1_9FIRM|nr:hypothetical protein [Faecalicatena contorta]PWJ49328.1 hypothetical protein A8805_10724 [Faecalicatena contorta]SUQ14572.1 hypothetical protein SAMN05216529_10724 [Faecalicatena contorta]
MEAIEFFKKAKRMCSNNFGYCSECPLDMYCCDGVFAADEGEAEDIIAIVEREE